MARISPLVIAPPLLFAGLAIMFFVGMQREDPNALPSVRAGGLTPDLVIEPLGDKPFFTGEDLRAPGVKLLNIWASWCAPCRVEHAQLVTLASEGIKIYGVNYKDDPDKALAFLAELGDPFAAVGADASGRTAIEWGAYGVPETFIIDGNGKVISRFAGPITVKILDQVIRPAIAKAAAGS